MKAIQHLSSGKAPGSDAIPAAGSQPMAEKPTELFHCIWRKETTRIQGCIYDPPIQAERKCSSLWQPEGHHSIADCWEDTGISSTESPERAYLDQAVLLPESGFRKDRWTIDMIFTARQFQEKCQEQNVDRRPHQSIRQSQSLWALENYGKVWLSSRVYSNGAAVSWCHACTGSEWWRVLSDKWSRAR